MKTVISLIITMTFSINAYSDGESFVSKDSDYYNQVINNPISESIKYACKSDHTEFTISVLNTHIDEDNNYKLGLLIQEDGLFMTMYRFSISERRWDWLTGGNNYSFIIKGNKGWYYDFTGKEGESVTSSAYFTCNKIELNKSVEPVEPVELDKSIEPDETESDDSYE